MKIKIETLTPIWTGGVDRNCDRIHETGIIGSLRWWYEAVARGLDGYACDPVNDGCPKVIKENSKEISKRCDSCELFGCTGWSRKFRLEIGNGDAVFQRNHPLSFPSRRKGGWYLGSGRSGDNIEMNIIPLRTDGVDIENLIRTPLLLASKWGGLGARTQVGFGAVNAVDENNHEPTPDIGRFVAQFPKTDKSLRRKINPPEVPNLNHFFFAKFHINSSINWWEKLNCWKGAWNKSQEPALTSWGKADTIPVALDIKDVLRYGGFIPSFGSNNTIGENDVAKYICGTIRGAKMASRINISSAYLVGNNQWEFRIWGWIPNNLSNRVTLMDEIYIALNNASFWQEIFGIGTSCVTMICWREKEQNVSGGRCTGTCTICTTGEDFLKCLLQ